MHQRRADREGGFIKLIINIIIAVAFIGYFASAIKPYADKHISDPATRAKVDKGIEISAFLWTDFIEPPASYLWKTIVEDIIWPTVESHSNDLKDWMMKPTASINFNVNASSK